MADKPHDTTTAPEGGRPAQQVDTSQPVRDPRQGFDTQPAFKSADPKNEEQR